MNDDRTIPTERRSAAQAVVRDALRRRAAGDRIGDGEILATHSHLLPELRQELDKLALIQRATPRGLTGGSSDGGRLPAPIPRTGAIDRFRGYQVVREIARGGQGAVFEAVQAGTQRRVAIKVVHRAEGASDSARFIQEAQFLARLRHPNIVAIHEYGVSDGDDYLVMDFIEGRSLSEWVEEAVASSAGTASAQTVLRNVVEVMAAVCDAVHAAHLRGIIHRDLKPANIRVTPDGRPLVLDFGLAKGIAGLADEPTDASALTASGQFVGSLPWSSPEQAAGRVHDVDVRTDVYALGVILYQCIAGRFPYEVRGPLGDVIQRILHADPAPIRRDDAYPLARFVDRDLECITLRALAKAPERRYQGAGELAADLQRYLAGDAIDARRDSRLYILRKLLRRHRVAASVAGAFFALSSAAAVVFAVQAGQIRAQRDLARAAEAAEHTARLSAERVVDFLEGLLSAADPFADPAFRRDVTLLTAVDLAAEGIESEFADEPEVAAAVRTVMGRTYRELGELDKAEVYFQAALDARRALLGGDHPDVAETLHEFALLRQVQTRYAEALAMSREALAILERLGGEDGGARGGGASADAARSRALNAHLLRELGRLDEAEAEARRALEIRRSILNDDDPEIAESLNALAGVLRLRGENDAAEAAYVEALDRRRASLGADHPDVATSLNNLATLRLGQKRWADAEPLLREAVGIYVARVGENHPYVARVRANLATALAEQGKVEDATGEYRAALAIRRALERELSADTALVEFLLGKALAGAKHDADARPALEQALASLRTTRGPRDVLTRRAATLLIDVYRRLGEPDLAAELAAQLEVDPADR